MDPRQEWLEERVDELIEEGLEDLGGGRVGVAVVDLVTGDILYRHNAGEQFNTASNTKLITTAAALALLGPDFRYRTGLYAEELEEGGVVPGDLYLRASGDPSLGNADLYELARDLKNKGVRRVRGRIVVDTSYFDGADLPPHFDEQPDEDASFRAPIGATSLNFNMTTIRVRPSLSGSGAADVFVDPPNDYVRITGVVNTVRRGRTRLRLETEPRERHLEVEVRGQIRSTSRERWFRRRVADPVQYVGTALADALAAHGIKVGRRRLAAGEIPDDAVPLALRDSPPLAVLVRGLGKYSNNYVAEMLLKTVGAETKDHDEPATWKDGLSAVRGFLTAELGFQPGTFRYENGSGLFDSNGFSPGQMVRVLSAAHRDFRWGPDFTGSLSIASADGTLSTRMSEGPAERQVRAKTGTLAQVSALSGYAAIDGRFPLAFSVLVNDFPEGQVHDARSLQDDIAEALVQFLQSAE